ncbi:MAG: glutathione S-transferase [Burkholderiales bacterium]|jgi:glutathione S-transferase
MAAEYTLHCFAQSGNAYKAALMLNLCDADWTPRFVDFFGGETRTPAYRALNVMGEVPVLEHRGRRLSQSGVILDYLAHALGRFDWEGEDERREVLRWLLWDNHKLTSYIATLRFLMQFAPEPNPAVVEMFRARAMAAIGVLETQLTGRDWVALDKPSIADLSLAGYLWYEREFGVDWAAYPAIRAWLGRLQAMPGWKHPYDLMPGHPLPAGRG